MTRDGSIWQALSFVPIKHIPMKQNQAFVLLGS
jgi:hypothetical protein